MKRSVWKTFNSLMPPVLVFWGWGWYSGIGSGILWRLVYLWMKDFWWFDAVQQDSEIIGGNKDKGSNKSDLILNWRGRVNWDGNAQLLKAICNCSLRQMHLSSNWNVRGDQITKWVKLNWIVNETLLKDNAEWYGNFACNGEGWVGGWWWGSYLYVECMAK